MSSGLWGEVEIIGAENGNDSETSATQTRLVEQRREIWRGVGGGVRGRGDWPVIAGVGLDPQRSDLG